jgi:hypothetical protein
MSWMIREVLGQEMSKRFIDPGLPPEIGQLQYVFVRALQDHLPTPYTPRRAVRPDAKLNLKADPNLVGEERPQIAAPCKEGMGRT